MWMTSSPTDLGFEAQYDHYWPYQLQTIRKVVETEKKLVVISAPTGSGKSIIALAAAKLLEGEGKITRILTKDIYLQNQYMSYPLGQKKGQGRSHFPCVLPWIDAGTTAAQAPCVHGFNCDL